VKLHVSAFDLAQRFIGVREIEGHASSAHVMAMLRLDADWPKDDSVPWCSGFVNYVAWLLRLPRSKSLAARSWLSVGRPIDIRNAQPENDVVILKRGVGKQPGPEVLSAPGHVGFFAGLEGERGSRVLILSGNQSDAVTVASFPVADVLGARRLIG
jgi:uncharacterized protein (TIGR02594 family)